MPSSPDTGSLDSARALGSTLLAHVGARVDLISLELQEQAERGKQLLLLALVAAVFLHAGLLLLAFLVVVAFWDTHRVEAIVAVTVGYSAVGAWAVWRIRALLADSPPPFAATRQEFENDIALLKGRDERA